MQYSAAACAAVECVSTSGVLEPQAFHCVFQGLHIAVPTLLRLTRARAPLRAVRQVLELWLQEADLAFCLDQRPGVVPGSPTRSDSPAASVGAGNCSSTSDARLALERELFSADMRASVRDASLEARRVLGKALATVLALFRDPESCDKNTMPALVAVEAATAEAAAASTRADDAVPIIAAAVSTSSGARAAVAAARAEGAEALEAARIATEARKEAVAAEQAVLAAARGGAIGPPLAGPAGAAATGAGNHNMGQAPGQAASTASGDNEAEQSEQVPDDASEGAAMMVEAEEVHFVADHLAMLEEDFYMGPDPINGRNTCACGLGSTSVGPETPA